MNPRKITNHAAADERIDRCIACGAWSWTPPLCMWCRETAAELVEPADRQDVDP